MLGAAEYARYSRQLLLPEFGLDAQCALKKANVLVIGAGGLGCPAVPVSYTHLTLPTNTVTCRSRWSPYH